MSKRRLSDIEVEERAATAQAMLQDDLVKEIIEDLRERYLQNFMDATVGSPEAAAAHSGMKILNDFQNSLMAVLTEKKMRSRYPSKGE